MEERQSEKRASASHLPRRQGSRGKCASRGNRESLKGAKQRKVMIRFLFCESLAGC